MGKQVTSMPRSPLRAYNTLTRTKELFEPLEDNHVRIYACGVTPYAEAHIGHARPTLIWSVIRKYLERRGYRVTLVQNFTDVDDKIIERARELDEDPLSLAGRFADKYLASMRALGIEDADHYPLVSEHIKEIVEMIEVLVAKDVAYDVDGDVFYDVTRFPEYGRLSGQRMDDLIAGTRIEPDERKRNPMDFALWKAAKPGEPAWDSPWGPGRPGWHIECSAMALKYLGNQIDFHGGGLDLVFPHHENELAQSEAYTGEAPFVRFWVHNGLVNMDAEKMSKSIGNVISVEELLQQYPSSLLRFFLLSTHYRSPLEFSDGALEDARRGWLRLNQGVDALEKFLREHGVDLEAVPGDGSEAADSEAGYLAAIRTVEERFDAAMADDFNTALALAALFDFVRATNAYRQRVQKDGRTPDTFELSLLHKAHRVFQELAGDLLGVLGGAEEEVESGVDASLVGGLVELLIEVRTDARKNKNWAAADMIRDRLHDLGIALEDGAGGETTWKRR